MTLDQALTNATWRLSHFERALQGAFHKRLVGALHYDYGTG
jgi:hypothetical protein